MHWKAGTVRVSKLLDYRRIITENGSFGKVFATMEGMRRFWFLGMCVAGIANAQADYPQAIWNPAAVGNQTNSSRPTSFPIQYIIIHITEGSYSGAMSWFQNEASNVSAHFVIRSSNGQVYQMVKLEDIAWHSGSTLHNNSGVGIEHEAISTISGSNPNPLAWFTDTMYQSSATLTRWLTTQYSIPRTRTYILGHREVRNTSCPSDYWDWTKYMSLVTQGAQYQSTTIPTFMLPGQTFNVNVQFLNNSDFAWTTAAGNNQVSLRTADPAGRVSPFFVSTDWISSSNPGFADADTPINGTGTFTFQFKAPTTPGTYTETFQLNRSSTGAFGPLVSFQVGVGRIDKVLDNRDPGFSVGGTWTTASSATDKYSSDYRYVTAAQKSLDFAEWYLDPPQSGTYEAYAWWPQGTNRTTAAKYQLISRRDTITRVMNQQVNGGQWNYLGRISIAPGSGKIRVLGQSTGTGAVVMADAVRIVGPLK